MTSSFALDRRLARHLARLGVVGAAVMLALAVVGLAPGGVPAAGAAGTDAGAARIVVPADAPANQGAPLTSGGSATPFSLALPAGAACPGDSAIDQFKIMSFMVKADTALAELQFDPLAGPNPVALGADFRQPLLTDPAGEFYTGISTANADTPGGPGRIVNIPAFSFAQYPAGAIPAGDYVLGIACILGTPDADQLHTYWSVPMTVTAAPSEPGPQIAWTTTSTGGTTTTTAGTGGTTTTTVGTGGTTTTTAGTGGTTTTTAAGGSTTTTAAGGSTTSTTAVGGSTTSTTRAAGGPSGTSPVGGGGLPLTGSSPTAIAVWAVVLLICGRIAYVLSRPPRVPHAG